MRHGCSQALVLSKSSCQSAAKLKSSPFNFAIFPAGKPGEISLQHHG